VFFSTSVEDDVYVLKQNVVMRISFGNMMVELNAFHISKQAPNKEYVSIWLCYESKLATV
jgi:hypothetical protein